MKRSELEMRISIVMAFVLPAIYFVGIQFATGALIGEAISFTKNNSVLWILVLFFAVAWFAILFVPYYIARIFEECLKVKMGKVNRIVFYYVLPIAAYLAFSKAYSVEFSAMVIVVSTFVRWTMEWLFLNVLMRMKKETNTT